MKINTFKFLYKKSLYLPKIKKQMARINIEIKARCDNHAEIRKILKSQNADFKGIDHQIDTYFNVKNGRLKLREGTIENNLIQYTRPNISGPKQSDFALYKTEPNSKLKTLLINSLGAMVTVDKQREISYIDNVKFHLDEVKGLGKFVEIEVEGEKNEGAYEKLKAQCDAYLELFKIEEKDLINNSYSDMLLEMT